MIIEREKEGGSNYREIGGDKSSEVLIQKVRVLPYNSVSRTRIDRCVFVQIRIDRSVYKKTYELFRGHSEESLRFSIDRWDSQIDRSHCYALVHLSDRSMRFWIYIHRSIRL